MSIIEDIRTYFNSNIYKPFYVALGDTEYKSVREQLFETGDVEVVRISRFCGEDKKPDLDKFRETLRMIDIDCSSNKVAVIGLGEYLALEGNEKARAILDEFISFNLGSAHAVFLLRGVSNIVKQLSKGDPRLEKRQIMIQEPCSTELTFGLSSLDLKLYADSGFAKVLKKAEDTTEGEVNGNTNLSFENAIIGVRIVSDSYQAITKRIREFDISREYGKDEEWDRLLEDIKEKHTLQQVFKTSGFDTSLLDFHKSINAGEYETWLYYLYLLINSDGVHNKYLKRVIKKSTGVEDFKKKILNEIMSISHTDSNYHELYAERKRLIKDYSDVIMSSFVSDNRRAGVDCIYNLTDNTRVEREEIIAQISQNGKPENLEMLYPDLEMYLRRYDFQDEALGRRLTEYFIRYKEQKVSNRLSESFLDEVDTLAKDREYNRLRTRDEIVSSIDKENTFMCWIDALGVEYLGFIEEYCLKLGLSISVKVGRAELPTLTVFNKGFYESWPDANKRKIEELDDAKHSEKGGYRYSPSSEYPIHLAKELSIIREAIEEAATELGRRSCDKYVIASDHGASRLAVIRKKEEKYDTDTQGEHSGRCCKQFPDYDLPFATEENGYLVLADYGRFKGSRAANVEVHGGASLEEVVVPVIVLSLRDTSIEVDVTDKSIKADPKKGIHFTLYINKSISKTISVEYMGRRYGGEKEDANRIAFTIPDIVRAGQYKIGVFIEEDYVSHIELTVTGKSASVNSDFDDLF